jgi:hypothetical protein
MKKYSLIPNIIEKVKILKLECLISFDENIAQQFTEEIISDHHRDILKVLLVFVLNV